MVCVISCFALLCFDESERSQLLNRGPPIATHLRYIMGGIKVTPLTAPAPYAASELPDFGRVVEGFAPKNATPEDYKEIEDLLYKHSILVFHGVDVDPEAQLALTKWFDKQATTYVRMFLNRRDADCSSLLLVIRVTATIRLERKSRVFL